MSVIIDKSTGKVLYDEIILDGEIKLVVSYNLSEYGTYIVNGSHKDFYDNVFISDDVISSGIIHGIFDTGLEYGKEIQRKEFYYGEKELTYDDIEKARKEGYNEGFSDGYNAMFSITKISELICPRCNKRNVSTIHHLIPRRWGGKDNVENLLLLCKECHDEIEEYTYNLFKKGKTFSPDVLRNFVLFGFPEEYKMPDDG